MIRQFSALWLLVISYWLLAVGGWLKRYIDIQTIQIAKSQRQEASSKKQGDWHLKPFLLNLTTQDRPF